MQTPASFYRVQFHSGFRFKDAINVIPYLKNFGISHLYASPITAAKKGSTHGYDVVEHNIINPELGSIDEFDELINTVKKHNMFWLQDIVPNHMSYSHENQMIIDLFENGSNSRYYNYFDIDWNHPHASVKLRVLAPFLGKFFKDALENCELEVKYGREGFSINYYSLCLPLKMESYSEILAIRLSSLRNVLGKNHPDMIKYLGVLYVLKSLPTSEELDERYDQIKFIKGMLWELYCNNEIIKNHINELLRILNGSKENPDTLNFLDRLLADQHFRLAFWKVATDEINYRRFFTVNELICLRMEREEVFNRTHSLMLKLQKEEKINGLRIDHIDGLYDPLSYLNKLREKTNNSYIVVEKILELEEDLPPNWPVQGTTGYEFTNYVNGLFCKKENEKQLDTIYRKFTKVSANPRVIMADTKRLIVQKRMAGDVERLAFLIEAVSSKDRFGIDLTMHALKEALEEILTFFPIYRTYVDSLSLEDRDRKYLSYVINKVKDKNPELTNEFDYIRNLLLLDFTAHFTEEQKIKTLDFVMKFQQLTGPLMAKGFEDTFLYVYNRLISLNEVGSNPIRFGITPEEFHRFNSKRNISWKHTINTTSTHDTKRGEDVRARINVISELPSEWNQKIKLWEKLNSKFKRRVKDIISPDKNDEYFLYQTLIGTYPFDENDTSSYTNRIKEYMIKAVREAKQHTAWIKPDEDYESACINFIENILKSSDENLFLRDFIPFQKKIAYFGVFNSLSQVLLKCTAPGIPDVYQGTELWDLSLVDPDNRRPVNFELRKDYLVQIQSSEPEKIIPGLLDNLADGKIKMYLLYKLLKARNLYPELFNISEYAPVDCSGKFKNNVVAYGRKFENKIMLVIAPRFYTAIVDYGKLPLGEVWENTEILIPSDYAKWQNLITGQEHNFQKVLPLNEVLSEFPVALLVNL